MFSTQSTATKHMCEISLCVCSKYFMKACNTTELYKHVVMFVVVFTVHVQDKSNLSTKPWISGIEIEA